MLKIVVQLNIFVLHLFQDSLMKRNAKKTHLFDIEIEMPWLKHVLELPNSEVGTEVDDRKWT